MEESESGPIDDDEVTRSLAQQARDIGTAKCQKLDDIDSVRQRNLS
jgi:hypothetical protein